MSEKIIKVGVVGLGRGTAIARCLKGVKNAKLIDAGYIKKDQFAQMVEDEKVFALKQEQMSVESAYKDIEYIDNIDALIVENVKTKFEKQAFTLDKDFTPMYVQLSQAEENLKVKNNDK